MTWRNLLRDAFAVLVSRTPTEDGAGGEEPAFDELEVVNSPTTKTESLERTLDRAESVLEGQLTTLDAIQEKAIRIVKVEVVLLGAIASFTQLVPQALPVNLWVKASGVLLIASMITGIFTSNSSSPDFGPGPDYVRPNFDSGDTNDDVYLELLQGYSEAISYNKVVMNDNARYVFITQILLVASIVVGCVGLRLVD